GQWRHQGLVALRLAGQAVHGSRRAAARAVLLDHASRLGEDPLRPAAAGDADLAGAARVRRVRPRLELGAVLASGAELPASDVCSAREPDRAATRAGALALG